MDEYQFFEDWWNVESEEDFRQPVCVWCFRDCAECLVKALRGTWHRGEVIIPKREETEDNEEVFSV